MILGHSAGYALYLHIIDRDRALRDAIFACVIRHFQRREIVFWGETPAHCFVVSCSCPAHFPDRFVMQDVLIASDRTLVEACARKSRPVKPVIKAPIFNLG